MAPRRPRMARRRRTCASCGSFGRPVRILYGLPRPEDEERARRGEVVLGGCLVGPNDPRYACPECGEPIELDGPAVPARG